MALDFPNTPALNEVYQVGTRTYVWNSTAWNIRDTNCTKQPK